MSNTNNEDFFVDDVLSDMKNKKKKVDGKRKGNEPGGVYSLVVDANLEDVDFSKAVWFNQPGLYASRLIQDSSGVWNLIGFWDKVDGKFVGELSDPIPVTADPKIGLVAI
jgi:beta-fructofuranosidase